ncbi:hypothetical protein MUN81_03870 [Hymenobacter sp. 5317J-9]|uniref:hypothetical protein n=1 Tax=Hymenobacter sp. 5317J-9 TaxID=2932250 RepID=UPI001FD6B6B5|nr:hypothetical protein [Hymenobacter sp. 5317J-9]UOQ98634.1 hypothetical protein MUN81_03870 [Hymenobacter sp. 5317J-9]
MKNALLCCLLTLLLLPKAHAQAQSVALPDSGQATASLPVAFYRHYAADVGFETRLYNGPEYAHYVSGNISGHQFFGSADSQTGSVYYRGVLYPGVELRYDLMRDQVVIKAPSNDYYLQLVSENLARFTIDTHSFVRVVVAAGEEAPLKTGFYEVLVDGRARLLAARRKSIQQHSTNTGLQGEMEEKVTYFIHKDGHYYKAGSANSVLGIFPEQKAALRKYLKAQQLNFGENGRERALTELVRYAAAPAPLP